MKKPILIIGGILVIGALVAAAVFFLTNTSDPKAPESTQQTAQSTPSPVKENHEHWPIALHNATFEPASQNATATDPSAAAKSPSQTENRENPHVTLHFMEDLADLALKHYHPAHSLANSRGYGTFTLNSRGLNTRYGLSMEGLVFPKEDISAARKGLLAYVLTPRTLALIFNLYTEECLATADEKAAGILKNFPGTGKEPIAKHLSLSQKKEFFSLCAKKLHDMGSIISRIAEIPDFSQKIAILHHRRQELNSAYYIFWGLNQNNATSETIDTSGKEIKKALLLFDQDKKSLIATIVNQAHPVMTSDEEILYTAQWIARRITEQGISMKTIAALGSELTTLAKRFAEHGETLS